MKLYLLLFILLTTTITLNAQMLISGVIDGPLSGGVPKAIEFYVYEDIPDLSIFGFGSANNGGGSDGEEFTFPSTSATNGTYIYVASETTGFNNFFGFNPDYTSSAASINGDDAIELFKNGSVFDVYGDVNADGSGTVWDYEDGWAYRIDQTGPDGSTFNSGSWTFSGKNALDGETSNSTATTPFPIGTFSYSAAVTPDAPVATVASDFTHESFTANWNASSGATTYFLDVSEFSNFSTYVTGYENLDVGNVTSYSVTSLDANTTYYYRVRANNSAGTSGNSNTISITTDVIPSTTVQFKNSSGSVLETSGTYNLVVTILYPDAGSATTADVVLISGDAADIGNYTTQPVTFAAGSSADETVVITITDDGVEEGSETLTFELQNISGGNSATVGSPSQFDLTITESSAGSYYDPISVDATGEQLRFELYNLIKGHIEFPYSSSSTDTWDIVMKADEDPNNNANVLLIYTGRTQDKSYNAGTSGSDPDAWNREHVWAKSRGNFGTDPGAGTDAHHLKACDASVNSSRSNKDFDEGGTQHSEATECYSDADSWEPRDAMKGDVARMIFYMDVRYEGERSDPELHLVDYTADATGEPVIGKLSELLQWHSDDPVDAFELNRNDVVYSYQQNRNPFIDHPEWVESIWGAGSVNSPSIVSVERDLKVPNANQNLVITAEVTDNISVSNVTLKYQIDEGSEQSLPMTLSGVDTYTATISESNYNNANLLKYHVVAEDNEGNFDYGFIKELFTGITPISQLHVVNSGGRLTYEGVAAKIQGVATVGTGVFSTSSLDVFVQDATSGINVYKNGDITTSITEGKFYTVCGIVEQFNGKTEIVPETPTTDIIDNGASIVPEPLVITIDQLLANPESYEGQLISVQQVTNTGNGNTWPAADNNANVEVTDNGGSSVLTLRVDRDTDLDDNSEPSWPKDVIGIFSQYDDFYPYSHDYQIQPRRYTDIANSVTAQLKIFLQGPFNSDAIEDEMFSTINSSIPLTSPYSEDPRKVISMPSDIVDWVLVELRTTENGMAVSSHSALLHKDGRIVADNGSTSAIRITADPEEYYIVVKHRNHLSVMSSIKINLSNN